MAEDTTPRVRLQVTERIDHQYLCVAECGSEKVTHVTANNADRAIGQTVKLLVKMYGSVVVENIITLWGFV